MLLSNSPRSKICRPTAHRQGSQRWPGRRSRNRPDSYRPQLLALEDRLPPGDTLLGLLAGSWLLGSSGVLSGTGSAAGDASTGNPAPLAAPVRTPRSAYGDATPLTSA